jgi:hypothetical protein
MASKQPGKKKDAPASPLDAKRKALLEHERKIAEQIARRERLIEEAPKLAKEQAKLRREEIVRRASRVEAGSNTRAALPDPRHAYEAQTITAGRGRRLKREQRRGMLTFFVLLAAFGCILAWVYFTLFRGL